MRKRVFFQNAAIMTVTSLLLRSIGIIFRIYVSNRIGAEGMGLYQLIISVYVLASSFAVAGLNTAVTRLCTDELACGTTASVKRVLYRAIGISTVIAFVSALVISFGADWIAVSLLHDTRAVSSLRVMTISLPFMGISSCIKGYFMARRRVTSSSVAQILEQLTRIGTIVLILEWTAADSVEHACLAVMIGDTVAEAISCLFMAACYLIDKRCLNKNDQPALLSDRFTHRLLSIALPITGGRYLSSGLRTAENIMVPHTLELSGLSRESALSSFGKLKGMALPLIFFPSSFLNAFSALLIPEISEAKVLSQQVRLTRTIERTLHLTLVSSILISGVFWFLAYPLGELVYRDREVGMMLRVLAPLAPVMYLESVVVGILKGLDQQTHSLAYSVLDSASRIALILLLLPRYGINGFFGVMVFSNLLTCGLNVYRLCKVSNIKIRFDKWIIRPVAAAALGISAAHFAGVFGHIPQKEPLLFCFVGAAVIGVVYLVMMPLLGCVTAEDITFAVPHRKSA